MSSSQTFKQSIFIAAPISVVDHCITDRTLMHRWLNPMLCCEPLGEWSPEVGSEYRFMIKIPLLQPALKATVSERQSPGLVVWTFDGFFTGRDVWKCQSESSGTRLLNRFEFKTPNPLVRFGFETFAQSWVRSDMQAQLKRLKTLAESIAASDPDRGVAQSYSGSRPGEF